MRPPTTLSWFRLGALIPLAFGAHCGGSSLPRPESEHDAATAEGGSEGDVDAGLVEAGMDRDRDAAGQDAAEPDAQAPSGRDTICGQATSWPAPLPAQPAARKAMPVGTQTFGFIEGPVWIHDRGELLFSDMDFNASDAAGPPARIRRLRPPTKFDDFVLASNGNGLALYDDDTLIAATHDNQGLSLFDLTSAVRTKLEVSAAGKHLNSPNDLTVRSDGTVYFTDPDWQLGPRSSETKITGVYRVSPPLEPGRALEAQVVEKTLSKPNGIALSPDERTLYVGSQDSEIRKYPLAADGSLGQRSKFADTGSSDGFAVDCAGNLYVTSGTVEVFSPQGEKLGDVTLDDTPSNAAFGGADRQTLYITAGSRLYSIHLNVPGFPY
ncbi:MAG: SMP-30/gluconolactonase/LRE family protein [Myxococcales bacterium]